MHLKKWLIAILVLSMILPGCWDIEELSSRSMPNVLFLDKGNSEKVKFGAVFFVPGSLLPPVVGTTQQFEKRNFVISVEGKDLTDGWNNLRAVTTSSVFFGQLRAIVISDEFARMNIDNFLDFVGRFPRMPLNIPVLVTKSDPEKLMDIKNKLNIIPGNYISLQLESPYAKPQAIPGSLWEVFAAVDNKTFDPFMPLIEEYKENYRIAGMAVFSGSRMVGTISVEETETAALIKEIPNSLLTVKLADNQGLASFRDISSSTKVTPKLDNNGILTLRIQMNVKGGVSELIPRKQTITLQDKQRLESEAAASIKKRIGKLMSNLQSQGSDPLGFGEKFKSVYPQVWKTVNWHQTYQSAKIDIDTRFTIDQTGMFR